MYNYQNKINGIESLKNYRSIAVSTIASFTVWAESVNINKTLTVYRIVLHLGLSHLIVPTSLGSKTLD